MLSWLLLWLCKFFYLFFLQCKGEIILYTLRTTSKTSHNYLIYSVLCFLKLVLLVFFVHTVRDDTYSINTFIALLLIRQSMHSWALLSPFYSWLFPSCATLTLCFSILLLSWKCYLWPQWQLFSKSFLDCLWVVLLYRGNLKIFTSWWSSGSMTEKNISFHKARHLKAARQTAQWKPAHCTWGAHLHPSSSTLLLHSHLTTWCPQKAISQHDTQLQLK